MSHESFANNRELPPQLKFYRFVESFVDRMFDEFEKELTNPKSPTIRYQGYRPENLQKLKEYNDWSFHLDLSGLENKRINIGGKEVRVDKVMPFDQDTEGYSFFVSAEDETYPFPPRVIEKSERYHIDEDSAYIDVPPETAPYIASAVDIEGCVNYFEELSRAGGQPDYLTDNECESLIEYLNATRLDVVSTALVNDSLLNR